MLRRRRAKATPADAPETGGDEFGLNARVDAFLDEVRGEADRILADARSRAAVAGGDVDQSLADRRRRLLELAEQLIARAEAVLSHLEGVEGARASLDRMVRALGEAADEISFELAAAPLGPRSEHEQGRSEDAGEGREAAIQMAAAGATRSQVASRLREFPAVGNPTELLDEVFGPMSAADSRVPWAVQRDDG